MQERTVPLRVRVALAHAYLQALAEVEGVDLLHIKGPAVAPGLRRSTSSGSDVDVLVRPAHVAHLMAALRSRGWLVETDFTSGSAFDHAANLYHPDWGLLDVHRSFPGMDRDRDHSFEVLWECRQQTPIATLDCAVPDRTAQSLLLLLHAARSPSGGGEHPDVAPNWTDLGPQAQAAITQLAGRVGAQVGLAAATGDLERYAGDPEAALWRWFRDGGSRLEEWQARWQVAPSLSARVSIVARSFVVNRYYLRWKLGHEPDRTEVAAEFFRRLGQAAQEGAAFAARRLRSSRDR